MEEDTYLLICGGAQCGFNAETTLGGGLQQEKRTEIWLHQHMGQHGKDLHTRGSLDKVEVTTALTCKATAHHTFQN